MAALTRWEAARWDAVDTRSSDVSLTLSVLIVNKLLLQQRGGSQPYCEWDWSLLETLHAPGDLR